MGHLCVTCNSCHDLPGGGRVPAERSSRQSALRTQAGPDVRTHIPPVGARQNRRSTQGTVCRAHSGSGNHRSRPIPVVPAKAPSGMLCPGAGGPGVLLPGISQARCGRLRVDHRAARPRHPQADGRRRPAPAQPLRPAGSARDHLPGLPRRTADRLPQPGPGRRPRPHPRGPGRRHRKAAGPVITASRPASSPAQGRVCTRVARRTTASKWNGACASGS